MTERLQQLPKQFLEWWSKFTSKQKTVIICVGAGILVAFAILVTVLGQPTYVLLSTSATTKETSLIKDLLVNEKIPYKVSTDGFQISVVENRLSDANLLLGANDIPPAAYDINQVFSGGFNTTESDKEKKFKVYTEKTLAQDLTSLDFVKSAIVQLSIPNDDGTLVSNNEESFANVILEIDGEMPETAPATLAQAVKVALGNKTTNNIVIMDTAGNLLFSGEDNFSVAGNASNQLTVKQQAESLVRNEVKKVLLGTKEFSNVEVASNLSLDFSTIEETQHDYSAPDGQQQGMLSSNRLFSSESENGTNALPPGTDTNVNDTSYVFESGGTQSSSTTEEENNFLPNETMVKKVIPPGLIKYDESSISVAAVSYKMINEKDAKDQGLLDGTNWNEYKLANAEKTKLTVDQDMFNMVSKATGIDVDSISIMAYEEPIFIDEEGLQVTPATVIPIVLIVLILALLAFVVFRSMRGEKEEEVPQELSVEKILQSQPDTDLNDLELESKSDARRVIEKFVDENPEAVASLLRNWLSEDWG